jgi:hypothetical protein
MRAVVGAALLVATVVLAAVPARAQGGAGSEPTRRVLEVGPTRALKTPSAAAAVAGDGDHIKIDAGQYKDCAVWRASNLFLESAGGVAHVLDVTCEDQAIWLFRGSRILVKGFEFSRAHDRENTGAGIKFLGSGLTVQDSVFHDNENGILVGENEKSQVLIAHSTFRDNGKCEPICAHGIYIGRIARLTVQNSTFTHQNAGHHIKSRAQVTILIGNRIEDGLDGTASFSVDLPNGGTALIRNNLFQKGEKSDNRMAMVSIGEEGAAWPSRGIDFVRNSFLDAHLHLDAFIRNQAPGTPVRIAPDNTFLGSAAMHYKEIRRPPQAAPGG